ncbi:hypothetical protein KGQ19_08730 [Catenulispora sp. NL8]|uniref:Uncharacterized protein n=1 Tax=Catenulispora pinistramenti TaxID=2705254 RepID=A0ABS5KLN2_9ACTN|nr:hypothetical protein [Catenulispora pinistramenti]MBS2546952.1 hypothetical protein [Catenulispora pinistramenti]
MARRTGASARTLALTKAQEAVAQRDAERIKREKQVEAALADFYQAQGEVERIHVTAEVAAVPFEAIICESVRSLDRLGETRPGIAGLTGLPLSRVRDCLSGVASNAPVVSCVDEPDRRGHPVADAAALGEQAPATMPVVRSGAD